MDHTPPRKRNNIGEREHEYVTHAEFKRMRVAAGLAARGEFQFGHGDEAVEDRY